MIKEIIYTISLFGTLSAQAGVTDCINNVKGLSGAPQLQKIVQKMGGLSALQGAWSSDNWLLTSSGNANAKFSVQNGSIVMSKVGDSVAVQACVADASTGKIIFYPLQPGTTQIDTSKHVYYLEPGAAVGEIKISKTGKEDGFYTFKHSSGKGSAYAAANTPANGPADQPAAQ